MLTSYLGAQRFFFDSRGVTCESYELVSQGIVAYLVPVSKQYLQSGFDGQMDGGLLWSAICGGTLKGA
jgi:hypothetical protein